MITRSVYYFEREFSTPYARNFDRLFEGNYSNTASLMFTDFVIFGHFDAVHFVTRSNFLGGTTSMYTLSHDLVAYRYFTNI